MKKDRVGEKWNNLIIVEFDRADKKKQGGYRHYWKCQCVCGNIKSIVYGALQSGSTKSCGCLKSQLISKATTLHGHAKKGQISSEFQSWRSMIYRCYNTNDKMYNYYGGRGIFVCDRWLNSFENFIEDMGLKPDKTYSIDRIENDGNYFPDNCRWATDLEQNNNQSTNIKVINTVTGEEYTSISLAAKSIEINRSTLYSQLTGKNPNRTNFKIKENEKTI